MKEHWLILDAMGVIFKVGRSLHELVIPFLRERGENIEEKRIIKAYLAASADEISAREFWARLGLEKEYPTIQVEYLEEILKIDEEFLELAPEFRKQYFMGYLSNDVAEWSQYLREKFQLNRYFDEIMVSGEVGIRKPDERIFTRFLGNIQALPEHCAFVDDSLRNVRAASRVGIKAIHFVRGKPKKVPIPFRKCLALRNWPKP